MVSRSPVPVFVASQRPRPRVMVPETFQASDAGLSDLFASARKAAEQVPAPADVLNNDRFVEEREIFAVNSPKWVKTMVF